jgi:hypothetical protein
MFIVHINAAGVEEIRVVSQSETMEDLTLAVWPIVRKELQSLDKKLKKAARLAIESEIARERGN